MKIIKIKAADPMPEGCKQPEPVMIEIFGNISEETRPIRDFRDVEKYFDEIAQNLFDALIGSLPQGVVEPLTIKLLQRRVSLYHGVMEPDKDKPVSIKKAVKNPCSQCGEEWDTVRTDRCPHCGNEIPF